MVAMVTVEIESCLCEDRRHAHTQMEMVTARVLSDVGGAMLQMDAVEIRLGLTVFAREAEDDILMSAVFRRTLAFS
jgi:hypothetical protein